MVFLPVESAVNSITESAVLSELSSPNMRNELWEEDRVTETSLGSEIGSDKPHAGSDATNNVTKTAFSSDTESDMYGSDQSYEDEKEAENFGSSTCNTTCGSDKVDADESSARINLDSADPLLEYEKIVSRRFLTEDEAHQFFLDYSKDKGFSVRKDARKYNTERIPVLRAFVCSNAGFKRPREPLKRGTRDSTRVGCPVQLTIRYDFVACNWYVHNFIDDHNHKLASTKEEAVGLRSHRKIPEGHKTLLLSMQRSGLRQYEAIDQLKNIHSGFENLTYTSKDVYNFYDAERAARIAKGDAKAVVDKLRELQEADGDFFFAFKTDDDGHLTHLFWADGQSREDYRSFGDVMLFDSTYRMNFFNMPFVPFAGSNQHRSIVVFGCGIVFDETEESFTWLLTTFLEAMSQVQPRSVITDGDHAMRKAIKKVLPHSTHRLCIWHININIAKNLHNAMIPEFSAFISDIRTPEEFEKKWKDYKKKFHVRKNRRWFTDMYDTKESWAIAFLERKLFLGIRTNQRSESLNAVLHKHLSHRKTLLNLFYHYERCVVRAREKEYGLDFKDSQIVPDLKTNFPELERSASEIYTLNVFKLVREEIKMASEYIIVEAMDDLDCLKYLVAHRNRPGHLIMVACGGGSKFACSCPKMESEGLPCRHLFAVLTYLDVTTVPKCCVLERWTKNAKSRVPSKKDGAIYGWSEHVLMFHDLSNLGTHLFNEAAKSKESYLATKQLLEQAFVQPELLEKDEEKILDPNKVKTKGRPKRAKGFTEKHSYTCKNCNGVGHSIRTCPNLRKPKKTDSIGTGMKKTRQQQKSGIRNAKRKEE